MKKRNSIKSIILWAAPELYYAISSYRFFQYCKKQFGPFQAEFANRIFENGEIEVLSGPFQGMRYFNRIVWGPITPKWLGSYEAELEEIINEIIRTKYEIILDVGAAEGYFAVGFSKCCPESDVRSFDVDPLARRRQRELAILNSTNNLKIGRYCSHNTLTKTLNNRSLLFCDIEGFEYELLDPKAVSKLREADILVEVHRFGALTSTRVKEVLIDRFSESHAITVIQAVGRTVEEWNKQIKKLDGMDNDTLIKALDEHRANGQQWLWMKSAQGSTLNAANTQ